MLLSLAQRRGLDGKDTIFRHIERTGFTIAGAPIWTSAELGILQRLYPDLDAVARALPQRTPTAITHKARQIGLVPPLRIWSASDAQKLRKPYVAGVPIDTLSEMFPRKSKRQIWHTANSMGYRRPRRAPKITGMPLVDSIRRRAFDLHITMTELDAIVGKVQYFVCPRHVDWGALQRAMEFLGGRPMVCWRER
ncbi:hypothetical protein [Rhizobium terrae]|uniref:hypothetical protein n=1 Tax=Rhizobium terrae TaxID=2171756 RepID=UPI000E3C7717|nr:hypothetical protein [Rhizobium terrae]